MTEAEQFWRSALADFKTTPPLAIDQGVAVHRGEVGDFGRVAVLLESEATTRLMDFARSSRLTLNTLLQAAWAILLARYSGEQDVVWGMTVSGRNPGIPDVESTLGLFINTLPMRVRVDERMPLLAWLESLQRAQAEFRQYDYCSLTQIQGWAKVARGRPLFDSIVVFENYPVSDSLRKSPAGFSIRDTAVYERTNYPLNVVAIPGSQLHLTVLYDTARFAQADVRRMLSQLVTVLNGMPGHAVGRVGELPLLQAEERDRIVSGWNGTSTLYLPESVHRLFEEQAALQPDAEAVQFDDAQYTYGELNAVANRIAHYLQECGVGPGMLVALAMRRSARCVASLLGILKTDAAYVPLDPDYPTERLDFMLADCGARVLLTEASFLPRFSNKGFDVVCLDRDASAIEAMGDHNPPHQATGSDRVYVMYTSGSTGEPKGVAIPHRGVTRLVRNTNYIELSSADRIAQASNISFDAATFEIWGALLNGAALIGVSKEVLLSPDEFVATLRGRQIGILFITTALFNQMAREIPDGFKTLRVVLFGGEAVDPRSVRRLLAAGPPGELLHVYGPTETTTFASWFSITEVADEAATIPIGRPISNTQLYVLDANRQPVPVKLTGELYIGGDGVALGYWNRPGLDAEKFIPDTFSGAVGGRLYRTGDLARYTEDGAVEFLGRVDNQVKFRGFRIELGEIESALARHAAVKDSVVLLRADKPVANHDERNLVAYLTTGKGGFIDSSTLRLHLKALLPEYMIPSAFVVVAAMPLTANGKIDRRALPAPDSVAVPDRGPALLPVTAMEHTVAEIWRDILGIGDVGRDDNFFDLGGHSLHITRVYSRLKKIARRPLSIVDLFTYTTVRDLAAQLGAQEDAPRAREKPIASVPAPSAEPIAIIGMAGRFPGARTIAELWRNLRDGVESIELLSDEELAFHGVAPELLKHRQYVKVASVMRDPEHFDAEFFGFNAREAEITDPQHRVFLECAHEALEDSGYDPARFTGSIGVYAGAAMSTYLLNNLNPNANALRDVGSLQILIGNDKDFVPTKVSYKLSLNGPSVNVQTACSTSLVAVHVAGNALLQGECDIALAGGVSILFPERQGYQYQTDGILSPDGHCRTFDAGARGTVGGSGSAVVVLKRLSKAQADGDTIHAVILGSAVNNDGSRKVGYTAPSVEGQRQVIVAAQARAGVRAEDISYIEAHGTATPLGDPVEIGALTKAFALPSGNTCAVGSIKSNFGHLDAAAGVAGLIKTVLQMKHGELVPSLHFNAPNPEIDFNNSPFYVNTHLSEWTSAAPLRKAGVSSFGIGGTNVHVILEEAPAVGASASPRAWQVLSLSAKNEAALETATGNLRHHLIEHPNANLADVAYTLHLGRSEWRHRRAVVCRDAADAIELLGNPGAKRTAAAIRPVEDRSVVMMFTGQGAQYPGMGAGLYGSERLFRETIDHCASLLEPHLGLDVRDWLFPRPENASEASDRLRETRLTQPCLFVVEYALAQLWMHWGVNPHAMIGHSVGEYVAACLAGVFSLEDALRLIAARARLLQSVPGGAMLAVKSSEDDANRFVDEQVSLAAVNGPKMCVLAGPEAAIASVERSLEARRIDHRRLHTSHAFHSAMVDSILPAFGEVLATTRMSKPCIPFISNLTGAWITANQAQDPDYWVRHMRQTVRFSSGVEEVARLRHAVLLEVGPGRTLSTLARPLAGRAPVFSSLPHPEENEQDVTTMLTTLSSLWTMGVSFDWNKYYSDESRRRIPLPTYPFQRQRYWIAPAPQSQRDATRVSASAKLADVNQWFYQPAWIRTPSLPLPAATGARVLLVSESASPLRGALEERLVQLGTQVVAAPMPLTAEAMQYEALLQRLDAEQHFPDWIVYMADSAGSSAPQTDGFFNLLHLVQAIGNAAGERRVRLTIVSHNVFDVLGDDPLVPARSLLLGPNAVVPQEYPYLSCSLLDVPYPSDAAESNRLADFIAREALGAAEDSVVGWRRGSRWTRSVNRLSPARFAHSQTRIRQDGVYLITGGLTGIGFVLARHLAETYNARLVLVGRSALPPAEEWDAWLRTQGASDPIGRRIQAVREIGEDRVLVATADVSERAAMAEILEQAKQRFGAIHGVIHSAGVPGGGIVQWKTREMADRVFAPKLQGLLTLHELVQNEALDFFLICSSLGGLLGGFGQVDYTAANAFQDAYAVAAARRAATPIVSVAWDTWRDVGMAVETEQPADLEQARRENLARAMSPEEGVAVFETALRLGLSHLWISTHDLQERLRHAKLAAAQVLSAAAAHAKETPARHALPSVSAAFVAPRTDVEIAVSAIWSELLGVEQIGANDDFFELGGHSLLAVQLISRLRDTLDVEIALRTLFVARTVAGLSQSIVENQPNPGRVEKIARIVATVEAMSSEQVAAALQAGALS